MTFHGRFDPKNVSEDFRERSLHRAAIKLNNNPEIPAVFSQESVDFLFQLGYLLARRGIMFVGSADEFLFELVIDLVPPSNVADIIAIRDLQEQKLKAISAADFEAAITLHDRQSGHREKVANMSIRKITTAEIVDALRRDGVDVDLGSFPSPYTK